MNYDKLLVSFLKEFYISIQTGFGKGFFYLFWFLSLYYFFVHREVIRRIYVLFGQL